jgi:hypothetical protein
MVAGRGVDTPGAWPGLTYSAPGDNDDGVQIFDGPPITQKE